METRHSVRMRDVNERTYAVLVDAGSEDGDFVCECEDTACFETIQLTLREYATLRPRSDDQRLLAPGHKQQQPVDA
jgi:hypothetical protein